MREARSKRRARERYAQQSEPIIDDDELVECGGEVYYAVDFTPAGFPLGPTLAEMRRGAEHDARGAGWARAKYILRDLLELELGAVDEIGWVKKIGDGVSRDIFAAHVYLANGHHDTYVVALPRRDADRALDERTRRELQLIAKLRAHDFPFRLPEMIGAFPDGDRLALVRRFATGVELDLRAGKQGRVKPWKIVAEIAAAIHAVPGRDLADVIPGCDTRAGHARTALAVFDGLEVVEMRDAHAWALAHLPPEEPSTLLHGDLLGQNILLAPSGPHHVIDWEYATHGDPAYDLAIVTRGTKRPFQLERGLNLLLDAYHEHGSATITADHVRVHELCLVAGWYRAALAGEGPHGPAYELDRMRSVLRLIR